MEDWIKDWTKDLIYKYLEDDFLQTMYIWHEAMWGVPIGPTLTMVHPIVMRGIQTQTVLDFTETHDEVKNRISNLVKRAEDRLKAVTLYPNHHPETALANLKAGHEVWDTNGDMW